MDPIERNEIASSPWVPIVLRFLSALLVPLFLVLSQILAWTSITVCFYVWVIRSISFHLMLVSSDT